jgi:carboxypeptidase Q
MTVIHKRLWMKSMSFCWLLTTAIGYAQNIDSLFIKKISNDILTNGKAYDNLKVLCKTVGGRLSGSAQMYKAEAWGITTLKAAGADTTYLQACKVPHWVRGGQDKLTAIYTDAKGKPTKKTVDALSLGNAIGTGNTFVQAPVLLINNFDELEKKKAEVKGKIVFYNYPFNPTYIQPFTAYAEAGVYRRTGPSRAAKYGAVAVIVRSMAGGTDNQPHTGATLYDTTVPKIPCAAIGLQDADWIGQWLASGKKLAFNYQSAAHFLPDTIAHNVIGEIKGSTFPKEIITIGGHLDSWDPAEGANDDGAGCVHAIEVLRTLQAIGYQPKRTIRIVLFANEENGLRGATQYAETGKKTDETFYFGLESDAGSFTPRGFSCMANTAQLEKMQVWIPLLKPYGVYHITPGNAGADVEPLYEKFKTPVAELVPDAQRYFDLHHTRADVFENVHKRELAMGAVNMTALIYLIDTYGL